MKATRATYERDAREVVALVELWRRQHPAVELEIALGPYEVAFAAPLDSEIVRELFALNEEARRFLAWIDCRSGYKATWLMLEHAIRTLGWPHENWTLADMQKHGQLVAMGSAGDA